MSLRSISVAILLLVAVCAGAPARAVSLYVASSGTDTITCGAATAPCFSLAQAVGKASVNDTIVCLDTVSGSAFTIIKSVDIDCSAARHIIRDSAADNVGAAIHINIPVSASDTMRTVRLRGISIAGASGNAKFINRGIDIEGAALVSIEGVVVSDVAQQGILDRRTGGSNRLVISDSIVRNSTGAGIVAAGAFANTVVLDKVRSESNGYGIAAAIGNNVAINRSVLSGNSTAGVEGDAGAQIIVNNSSITHNGIGVQSASSIRLSNNDIAFNATAVSGASGTFGNNRFSGNVSIGTAPTPLGGASSDLGQQ